jgi:peptidoglycan-associated lipoprotein
MNAKIAACFAGLALVAGCSSDNGSNTGAGSGADAAYGPGGAGRGGAAGYGAAGHATPGTEEDLIQSVGDRVFFDTDQSTLRADARTTLDRQAAWLQQYPMVRIWIAGNCDERGTQEYNLALGQRRAAADRDYLIAHGVERSRIETISYGSGRPVDPASSAEAWAKNRNAITSVK